MVSIGREGLEMSLAANSDYLYSCSVSTKSGTTCILNSRGLRVEYAKTDMAALVGIQEVSDSGLLEVYEFKSWSQPFGSLSDIAEAALTKMRQAGSIVPAKAEVMPVIFTPKALENLLEPVMLALNGKLVHKGASRLAGRIGERVLDERITILDDASVPYALNSAPVDCEGIAARQFALVEKGVLRSYLLDLQTAGLLGMKTTGSGHRSYAGQPAPSPSNTVIEPGSDSFEDMVSGLKRGLVADQTLGSGQSNMLAGEFSVNVSLGFLVEDGKIRGRAKNCMVAGNVYELLSKVEGLSRERQWLGADHVPAICVSGIRLAAQSSENPDAGA
jgi:PmbA protein